MFNTNFSCAGGLEQFVAFKALRPDGSAYHRDEWPFMRSLKTGEFVRDEEMHIVREDGSKASILVTSNFLNSASGNLLIIIIKDISRVNALAGALRESQDESRALLEVSPSIGLVLDTLELEESNRRYRERRYPYRPAPCAD